MTTTLCDSFRQRHLMGLMADKATQCDKIDQMQNEIDGIRPALAVARQANRSLQSSATLAALSAAIGSVVMGSAKVFWDGAFQNVAFTAGAMAVLLSSAWVVNSKLSNRLPTDKPN